MKAPPPADGDRPAGASPVRRRLRRLLELALAAAILLFVVRFATRVGWESLWQRSREADPLLLALAAVVLLARAWTWHLRWTLILTPLGEGTPEPRRFAILQAATLANHVVPSMRLAGGLFRARYLARGGPLSFAQAYGTVFFDMTIHHATSAAASWLALIGACALLGRPWTALLLFGGGSLAALWLTLRLRRRELRDGVLARYLGRRLRDAGARFSGLAAHGREIFGVARRLAAIPALRVQLPLLSSLWFVATIGEQWIVFRALDAPVGPWTVAAAAAAATIATAVTGVPGGAGPAEGAMVATFVAFGVDRVDALAGTLLARGIHYGVVLALGLPSLLYCALGRRPQAAPEGTSSRRDPSAPGVAPARSSLGAGSRPDPAP